MKRRCRVESRGKLLATLDATLRTFNAQSVLLSDTVALRVGHHSTDLECLDLLYLAGPTTAGHLAAHTGLTTGATTAVIDRLEQAGFVRRRRDGADRRRVLVEVLPRAIRRLEPLYARLATRMAQLNEQYTDRELGLLVEYLSRALDICSEQIGWLQTQPSKRKPRLNHRRA